MQILSERWYALTLLRKNSVTIIIVTRLVYDKFSLDEKKFSELF